MKLPLGRTVEYSDKLDPSLLFPISRSTSREVFFSELEVPFEGRDLWRLYELSWLAEDGTPQVGIGTFGYSANSESIVESKSLKLFLNSFNNHSFKSLEHVQDTIQTELLKILGTRDVEISIATPDQWKTEQLEEIQGRCIDLEKLAPYSKIEVSKMRVNEVVYSHLLRSLCPVTGQPDWGTLVVAYEGKKIDSQSLLAFLVQHRNFQGFHEQCCEKIFIELLNATDPSELTVGCFYTRRGGIDINPIRWMRGGTAGIKYQRLIRQ